MVASIMSKKLAAGSTHLVIDLPVGPAAKWPTRNEAMRLRKLFEFVGDHFGIAVEVITTDGRQPIGWGIGPVLEAQDVMAVLANDPSAPVRSPGKVVAARSPCPRERSGFARRHADTHGPANCSKAAPRSSRCKRSSTLKAPRPAGPTRAR